MKNFHGSFIVLLKTMKNITVIGSGTMGNGIAHTFAQCGYSVNLLDINEAALQKLWQPSQKTWIVRLPKAALQKKQKQAH